MSLESTHPFYDFFKDDWVQQRDLVAGERAVKQKRDVYLPPTPSMLLDGFGKGATQIGEKVYEGYLKRAQFPDYVSEGVEILVGMLNHKAPTFELPAKLKPLLDACTLQGESLQDLLRKIHTEQLTTGRMGILADLPATANADGTAQSPKTEGTTLLPYIATYVAETMINWDEAGSTDGLSSLNLVVLDESGYERDVDFSWKKYKKFRVLQLGSLVANESEGAATYKTGTFSDQSGGSLTYVESSMAEPMFMGTKLEEIPFVFINTKDLVTTPDKPPLAGLGRLVLAIYRGEADYRQSLFMQGQDTLVVIGGTSRPEAIPGEDDAVRTGAGSRIDVDVNGDAKYIGVNSEGLSEQRSCLENDHKRAATKSGQLLPSGKANSQESGEALKTRLAAQTASLTQIAMTSAKGLEVLLKSIATWVGANPDEVKVTPNLEFGELQLLATDITELMKARLTGAPLSKKSIHGLMVEKRLTTMTFEEEMEQINEEDAAMPRVAAGASTLTAEEQLAQQQAALDAKNKGKKPDEDTDE
jgi:hypothetical protein